MTCEYCNDDQIPAEIVGDKLMCINCKASMFKPTHKDEFGEPVEIIDPPMWLAGMLCVRRADGYEWYVRRLSKL